MKSIIEKLKDPRNAPWVGVAITALVLVIHALTYLVPVDDAFIAYRYAENFADGHGLVFNPDERVEGYTDFLWVALLAIFHWLGASTRIASQVMGIAAAATVVPVVYWAARECFGLGRWAALLPASVIAVSSSTAMWAGAGMETPLYMTLFTLAMTLFLLDLQSLSKFPFSGLVFGLAALTRPEAAGMFGVAVLSAAVFRATPWRTLLRCVAAFVVVVTPHFLFRLVYYGYPFPNTFYVKGQTNALVLAQGLKYLGAFVSAHGIWVLPFIVILLFASGRYMRRISGVAIAVLVFAFSYVAYVGGDFYIHWRFLVPYLPLLVLLANAGAWILGERLTRRRKTLEALGPVLITAVLTVSMLGAVFVLPRQQYSEKIEQVKKTFLDRRTFGKWLRSNYPSDTKIAIAALGIIPYYSGFYAIDMLGLTDEHIAHREMAAGKKVPFIAGHTKFDSDYVLSKEPDIVVVEIVVEPKVDEGSIGTQQFYEHTVKLGWGATYDLLGKQTFRFRYSPRLAPLPSGERHLYFERDPALENLMAALSTNAGDYFTYVSLAAQARRQGLFKAAIAALGRAMDLTDDTLQVLTLIAHMYLEWGKFDEAYEAFRDIRRAYPEDPHSLHGMALSKYRAGDMKQAVRLWEEYLRTAPRDHPDMARVRRLMQEARKKQ